MMGAMDDLPEIAQPPIDVDVLAVGGVRLSATLQPVESKHGALVRDLHPAVARRLAIQLLEAAEQADLQRPRYQ